MRKATSFFMIAACFFLFIGMLFKNMHWPGAAIGVVFGTMLSWIAMLLYFILRYKSKEEAKISTYVVYFYFFIMAIGNSFLVGNHTKDLLNSIVMIEHGIDNSRQASKQSLLANGIPEEAQALYDLGQIIIQDIDGYKQEMIEATGGVDDNNIPIGKDNQDIGSSYVMHQFGTELKEKLIQHQEMAETLMGESSDLLPIQNYGEVEDMYNPGYVSTWESRISEHLPLAAVTANLSLIQNRTTQISVIVNSKLSK